MFLKRLEIQGFKSFANHVELYFGPGITCVVGPNGCGKSNIYDAINWVLGEQRAKTMRGTKMEDLIFAGSAQLKAMGLAEVSLTFGNAERLNLQNSEVTITRRLYRSGESEYLINKKTCRLKDISNIFRDTGIGLNSYSMMEQGKVDRIISSRPIERRAIFEEAAGISTYRKQKEEALRKLDYTKANLTRLNDIIDELTRQMNSVNRHAAKARRYQKLFGELRVLEISHSRTLHGTLSSRLEEAGKSATSLSGEQEKLRTFIREIGEKITGIRLQSDRKEAEVIELQKGLNVLIEQISDAQNRVRYNTNRFGDLERRHAVLEDQIKKNEEETAKLESDINTAATEEADMTQDVAREKSVLDEALSALNALNSKADDLRIRLKEAMDRALSARRELAEKNNTVLTSRTQTRVLDARMDKLRQGQNTLAESIKEDEAGLKTVQERIDKLTTESDEISSAVSALELSRRNIKSERDVLDYKLMECVKLIAEEESKHKFLTGLRESFEGFGKGVKELLANIKNGNIKLSGSCVPLADILKLPVEHAAAIEAVLGESVQSLVVDSVEDANICIDYLRQNNLGKVRFWVSSLFDAPAARIDAGAVDGLVGAALDIVPFNQDYTNLVTHLLTGVFVVSDLGAVRANKTPGATFVTPEGDFICVPGSVTGGSAKKEAAGILTRDRQINAIAVQLEKLNSQKSDLDSKISAFRTEDEELAGRIDEEQKKLGELRRTLSSEQGNLRGLEFKHNASKRSFDSNENEISEIGLEIKRLSEEEHKFSCEIEEMSDKDKTNQDAIDGIEAEMAAHDAEKKSLSEKTMECRIRYNSLAEKQTNIGRRLQESRFSLSRQRDELDAKRRERDEIASLFESIKTESAELDKNSVDKKNEKAAIEEKITAQTALIAQERSELEELGRKQEEARNELESIASENSRREVELAEIRIRKDNLLQKIREEYDFNIEEDTLDCGEVEVPEGDELGARVTELKDRIKSLGPVNMVAIEEYQELEERFGFLNGQRTDLVSAESKLRDAIEEINKTSIEMFSTAFDEIRKNFQETFSLLFPGGEADVFLTEPDNILESGIDIEAKPGGKKKQNLSLLSGGEKAMTSISLLFALFLSKPSPFCIMDEVDAPLDDSNISRFVDMVRDFSVKTQFIMVTHNKKTMAEAREIYGVSMEKGGTSRVISLELSGRGDGRLSPV